MERNRRFQHRNPQNSSFRPSSSSTSSRESTRLRSNKISSSDPPRPANSTTNSKGRAYTPQEREDGNDSSNHLAIVGNCPFMCPEGERSQRERLRDLAAFERLNGNPSLSSPSLAVKKFCRTITTKQMQASDVRPLPVLEDTLKYLLDLLDTTTHPFEVVHDFIFDRTRSIRQDLSMQNIVNEKAIRLYEEMVKFYIISHYKLRSCSSSPDAASIHYLNMEQLTKTLMSLFNLYDADRSSGSNSASAYKNEPEFRSFYVLLHLGSNSQPMIRAMALSCINTGGYKLHPYPLAHLSRLLMMKESDLESFCSACGLETSTDEEGNKLLPSKQTTFSHPKGGFQRHSFCGLERFEALL
ncbi:hypothetical protein UlMin_024956 [Ulmus minor]